MERGQKLGEKVLRFVKRLITVDEVLRHEYEKKMRTRHFQRFS